MQQQQQHQQKQLHFDLFVRCRCYSAAAVFVASNSKGLKRCQLLSTTRINRIIMQTFAFLGIAKRLSGIYRLQKAEKLQLILINLQILLDKYRNVHSKEKNRREMDKWSGSYAKESS